MNTRARWFRNQQRAKAAQVITTMERGASLNLSFTKSGSLFILSDGTHVAPEVAIAVINDVRIVVDSSGLFSSTPQSWKYEEPRSF